MNIMVRLAPALAAGNTVVLKPSENCPRSAVLLARIASEAGLPDGTFNVVLGPGALTGRALAAHSDVDLVTFTGSTRTGLEVSRAAASATLKPVLLECGGKSPQIVLEDAFEDPHLWGPIFFSSFWNSGQWCAAKTRLLVPRSRIKDALEGLQQAALAWRVGDPLQSQTLLGPLVNAAQLSRVRDFCSSATAAGEVIELECPREGLHPRGNFMIPSVALEQPRGSRLTREEVFGPIITLEAFDGIDDAIALANDTSYGLMASIWTHRSDLAHRLARSVVAGAITICSSATAAARSIPDYIGGYLEPHKQSGHGVDGGAPGLLAYTTAQSISWLH
jgi:gamma-glutamyl-gamma-aminobutyraldehyde dehydrogenase